MSEPRPDAARPQALRRNARAMRWAVGLGLVVLVVIGLILLLLLTLATNNRELYERNYARLFGLNAAVALLLLAVIVWVVWRLLMRFRAGRFGSRLLVKLAAIFALVGFAPGVLIYFVSYQFVSRSIESWFDVKVEGALDAGLNLGRASLDALANDLANKTKAAAAQMAESPDVPSSLSLERLREQLGADDLVLWTAGGQLINGVGQSRFQLNPERPSAQALRTLRAGRPVTALEGLDDPSTAPQLARVRVLSLVSAPTASLFSTEARILQVTQRLPASLVTNAIAVQEAHREYQERALGREGLRRMYIGTLTLSLFLAVFAAILLAVVLGNQIARPLLLLAAGVREVAAGDLSPKPMLEGKDELGGLTRSFADMTRQLADARGAVERSMGDLDAARANLQTILDNLTAGVIVLNAQGEVLSCNPGATRILRVPVAAHLGRCLGDVPGLEAFGSAVQAQFDDLRSERSQHGVDHWQQSFELGTPGGLAAQSDGLTLVARGAELPDGTLLLVFDDISEVVSAQRARAWGEVARRLAHEIKNPLTPIQLSAERLQMKLTPKLSEPADAAMLQRAVRTIVDQVDAMKRLVNEFRDYARLPGAQLAPVDLNELIRDVMQLYSADADGESAASGLHPQVPVVAELDPQAPPILGDAQQLRQVLHNLIQNAVDASEGHPGAQEGVRVRTHWVPATQRVRLIVRDHGAGFPESILKRAFEPYVTTKPKGTGLGLAVVKKIADEHGARIDLSNRTEGRQLVGAQVSLSFAVAAEQQRL